MAGVEKKWYVLRAVSGKEAKVKEYIDAEIKNGRLKGLVAEVLIPTEKVAQVRNGKRIVKERSYLPGYVLVLAKLVGEIAHELRSTPNVLGFLSESKSSTKPAPVSQSEINKIMGNVDDTAVEAMMDETFFVGEHVKVISGAFNGFEGVINEVSQDKRKLKVVVTIFDRQTPLELGFDQVAKE